jgi:hypothetical protein
MKEFTQESIVQEPDSQLYYLFYAEKFDMCYARNILLNFIEEKGLSEECLNWILKIFPDED